MDKRVVSPPLDEIERLRPPLTHGERLVLDYFLANLPQGWEIYIQPHLNGLRPDFVLLHPENGIAVYEVKDWNLGSMEYFVENNTKTGPKLMARKDSKTFLIERQNPVPKIDLYKEEIYALYCPRLPSGNGFGTIVSGIIFPFAPVEEVKKLLTPFQIYYGHYEHSSLYPIVGSDTLNDNREWTFKKKVLPSVYRLDERMSPEVAADLRHWLVEPDFAAEQRRPLIADLSPQQRTLVTTRTATGYRRIKGAAGSGKTFVLAGRSAMLAAEGKQVLVITFNITLINYILDLAVRFKQSGKVRNQIVALNFHAWCKRVANATGHYGDYESLWQDGDVDNVLKTQMASEVKQWLRDFSEEEKWDAILVDEGQDIELGWWKTLMDALKSNGEAMLCADDAQNIYEVKPWTDDPLNGAGFKGGNWKRLNLEKSFRLSPALCALARQFITRYLSRSNAQMPESQNSEFEFKTVLKWWQIPEDSVARCCLQALMDMISESEPPLAYADLTCIVENESIGLDVVKLLKARGVSAIHTFGQGDSSIKKYYDGQRKKQAFFKGDARVKITTLHSFKGWESKALVVHIGNAKSDSALALAYVGITRLKRDDFGCYMTVVCAAPELAEFGKKWPINSELSQ